MTVAQFEERLTALEKAVAQLQAQLPRGNGTIEPIPQESSFPREEEILPEAEYILVPDVPPKEVFHLQGRLVRIERGPTGLGLSDAEWAGLGLEEDDEG